jgi:hypothetical protein
MTIVYSGEGVKDTSGNLLVGVQNGAVSGAVVTGGRRNLIINGAMQVAQRGTSFSGITTSGYKTCDRWRWVHSESTGLTMSQDTSAPSGFGSSCKILVTTADTALATGAHSRIEQHIEGQNVQALKFGTSSAESITVSFWVKSNKTGSWSVGFYGDDTGTNSSQAYSINSADTWEYKTVTFIGNTVDSIDNDNGTGLRLWFSVFAGSERNNGTANTWDTDVSNRAVGQEVNLFDAVNNYWQITGVQLEVGSVATPFEHRSYGEELALCQRYFQVLGHPTATQRICTSFGWTTGMAMVSFLFPYEMRAAPSVSATDGTKGLLEAGASYFTTSIAGNALAPKGASLLFYASGLTQYRPYMTTMMPGYYLQFDAEL